MSKLRNSNINCLELCLNQSATADKLGNLMHFLSQSKLRNCSQKYSNFRDLCHYELNNTTGVTFKTIVSCNTYFLALSKNIFTFQKYFCMTNELPKFVWELGIEENTEFTRRTVSVPTFHCASYSNWFLSILLPNPRNIFRYIIIITDI